MKFCEWLKVKRSETFGRPSQETTAKILHVKLGTYRSWEQGAAEPPNYYQYMLRQYWDRIIYDGWEDIREKEQNIYQ